MAKIAVLADLHIRKNEEEILRSLAENELSFPTDNPSDHQTIIERLGDAEIAVINPWTPIDIPLLNKCPTLKALLLCGTSTAKIDVDAVAKRGIILKNVTDYGDEPTAEFVFMQLIAIARGVGKYQWQTEPSELKGKNLGIIGLGELGKAIAKIALAFEMNVFYYSLHRKDEWEKRGLRYLPKNDLIKESQILLISSPTNRVVLERNDFSNLQDNSILVQASIGKTFDQTGFTEWITGHKNTYAIFDGAAGDTIIKRYKNLPRVIISNMIAGHTQESKQRLGEQLIENLKSYLSTVE